ncbi:MAG: NTP transferase domain-containing protein, partial [Candidatus Omnitrophica bacterium]|nr:NTP transferase domain-containing protein [Candidatus Omnitrophota bacterium]
MKILIPMGGTGQRFLKAGYRMPKPLIPVDGIPVIEHIIRNFSGEDTFVFGIHEDHERDFAMSRYLRSLVPQCKIVTMPYQADGPVGTVRQMLSEVDDEEPVIVNHCDFSWTWDYADFKRQVRDSDCGGAIACYTGFHPHLLGPNLYATCDADGKWMNEIREKFSRHGDKEKDWTSSGTYYFGRGRYLKKYCARIREKDDWKIRGEHYVSQLFQLMKGDGLRVLIYPIPYMLQWGTPEDLKEYLYWSRYFRQKGPFEQAPVSALPMNVVVLMAGAGKRFSEQGYEMPKPFIPVDDSLMVIKSTQCLPHGNRYIFISRQDLRNGPGEALIQESFPESRILYINALSEGQAVTALFAENEVAGDAPLLIGACDHAILFDRDRFQELASPQSSVDALIFTFRHHPVVQCHPEMFGWVRTDDCGRAVEVSVKVPLPGDLLEHHAIIGAFWFRKAAGFMEHAHAMIEKN